MAAQYSRGQVIARIQGQIDAKRFVLMQGAGIGLIARLVEKAGVDLIAVYNTGFYRMNGWASIYGTLPVGNANDTVLDLARQIAPVVKEVPLIGGIYAHDPTRDHRTSIEQVKAAGCSGIINVPTIGRIDGTYRRDLESVGITFQREVDLMSRAIQSDLYTVAYVYTPHEAAMMAEAGVDMIAGHVGLTAGGDVGATQAIGLDKAAQDLQAMFEAIRAVNDRTVLLSHGGPIITPDDAMNIAQRTGAVGFVGASSIERIPVEPAVRDVTERFKQIVLP